MMQPLPCDYLMVPSVGLQGKYKVENENDSRADVHWPCDVSVDVDHPWFHAVSLNDSCQAHKSADKAEMLQYLLGLNHNNLIFLKTVLPV